MYNVHSSEVNQSKFKLRHIFVNLTKIVSPWKNIRVMRVTFSTLRCKIWKKLPASRGSERQLPWPCFSMYASSFRSSSAVHGPFFSPIVSSQHGALPMATYNSELATYLPNVSQQSNWIPPPPPPPELNLLATQSWTSASYWLNYRRILWNVSQQSIHWISSPTTLFSWLNLLASTTQRRASACRLT